MDNSFQTLLTSMALAFITEPDFQLIFNASGLNWKCMPAHLDPVICALKYCAINIKSGHELALEECRGDIDYLSVLAQPKLVPRSHQALTAKFNESFGMYLHIKLAERIINFPDQAKELLADFSITSAKSISSADVFDFVPCFHDELIEEIRAGKAKFIIPGFEMTSEAIGGFNPGRLHLLLATTGYGKTQFGINLALKAALKLRVAYINQEMILKDISRRISTIATRKTFDALFSGQISKNEIEIALRPLKGKLVFTGGEELSVHQIKSWLKMHKLSHPFDLVIIDYDQRLVLQQDRNTPEWQAMKNAVQELESLAKEMNFCCLLIGQLNREGEISASHRAQYAAHSVLVFEEHPEHGPVIYARKNRHGKRKAGVKLNYIQESGLVVELASISIENNNQPRKLNRKKLGDS